MLDAIAIATMGAGKREEARTRVSLHPRREEKEIIAGWTLDGALVLRGSLTDRGAKLVSHAQLDAQWLECVSFSDNETAKARQSLRAFAMRLTNWQQPRLREISVRDLLKGKVCTKLGLDFRILKSKLLIDFSQLGDFFSFFFWNQLILTTDFLTTLSGNVEVTTGFATKWSKASG